MCLARITENFDPPIPELLAWKVFIQKPEGLFFPHWTLNGQYQPGVGDVPEHEWLVANKVETLTLNREKYISGFHVFRWYNDAAAWTKRSDAVVFRVTVKNIRLAGLHCKENCHKDIPTLDVFVADEMCVGNY